MAGACPRVPRPVPVRTAVTRKHHDRVVGASGLLVLGSLVVIVVHVNLVGLVDVEILVDAAVGVVQLDIVVVCAFSTARAAVGDAQCGERVGLRGPRARGAARASLAIRRRPDVPSITSTSSSAT